MELSLIFNNSQELRKFFPRDILCIQADRDYVTLFTVYEGEVTLTMQLGEMEQEIRNQLKANGTDFIRVGRSYIINSNYISYINPNRGKLTLRHLNGKARDINNISPKALHSLMELMVETKKGGDENDKQ